MGVGPAHAISCCCTSYVKMMRDLLLPFFLIVLIKRFILTVELGVVETAV